MESLLDSEKPTEADALNWRSPLAWFRGQSLSRGYWQYFMAAFFYDAGFSVYVFLFNLYLLDCGFNERAMGLIGGAATLGTLVGTLPAGALGRRFGLKPLLYFVLVAGPAVSLVRVVWVWEPAQIALGFLSGLATCSWAVCYLPVVARLTTERNRTFAFSLIYSASIGTSILGGIVCGYLRQWLSMATIVMQAMAVKRMILLASCCIAIVGLVPLLQLSIPAEVKEDTATVAGPARWSWLREWKLSPFLQRFLPLMALWSAMVDSFDPFGNIYLSRELHIPFTHIGLIFSAVQGLQLCMGLLIPIVFRVLGLVNGIVAVQIAAALTLASMGATGGKLAVGFYLTYSAVEWMSSPGLYNLLMDETPDSERSNASAMVMFCSTLVGAGATVITGAFFTKFGYMPVLLGLAAMDFAIGILFRLLIPSQTHKVPTPVVEAS